MFFFSPLFFRSFCVIFFSWFHLSAFDLLKIRLHMILSLWIYFSFFKKQDISFVIIFHFFFYEFIPFSQYRSRVLYDIFSRSFFRVVLFMFVFSRCYVNLFRFFLGFIQIKFILKNKKYLFLNNIAGVFGLA